MSKKPLTEKASSIKVPTSARKTYKVFAVFFHGTDLEALGKKLAKNVENGPSKKILAVNVKDILVKGEEHVEDASQAADQMKKMQIEQGIEKCKKQFDLTWRSLPTQLQNDLKVYWNECSEIARYVEASIDETQQLEEIIPRKIKDSDMQLFNEEIQNEEIDRVMCDFFIVIFGKVSHRILLELAKSHIPLEAIVHFIQCPENTLQANFPHLHEEIDLWNKSPDTKNVAMFIESCMPARRHLEEQYENDIYDQFIWYLYDIEMLRQQFTTYKAEFVEINDSDTPGEEHSWPIYDEALASKVTSDDTAVGVYLDNLCYATEKHALKRRRHSCLHLRPFIENDFGRIIVEEANKLVQAAIATQMNMVSYWRVADVIVNALKEVPNRPCCDDVRVQLPPYYELLSWESFAQRVETQKFLHDENYRIDLTDKCKLYILQRTFNKVMEVKRAIPLFTKLCYRDFCQYIVPKLGAILQCYKNRMETAGSYCEGEEEPDQEGQDIHTLNEYHYEFHDPDANHPTFWNIIEEAYRPKFYGLTFSDTLQQLAVTEKVYRFDTGSIRSSLENWLYMESKLTIEMHFYDCRIYAHRWEDFPSEFQRVRLITKNNVTCNVAIREEQHDVNVSIQWPNDCQIQYVYDSEAEAVEQRYHWTRRHERKRLYTPQGCVLNYLMGDIIEVLTPNGIIYMLYPSNYMDTDDNDAELKYYQPVVGIKITDELAFVRSLHSYGIDCEHFDVTRSDGKKLRVLNGIIVEEKAHYLVYEWTDYATNQCYAERDDGIKMVWSADYYKCYYPCGTVITTTASEDFIEMSFGCLNKSMQNILRKMNPTLVEKVANKVKRQDTLVTYKLTYLMQHKNYASITFNGDDEMEISSPDDLKLVLKHRSQVLVSIGDKLEFRITSAMCHICSGSSVPREKDFYLRLCLNKDVKEVLNFHHQSIFLTLYSHGEMILKDEEKGPPPKEEEIYFLAKRYKFGMAFLSEEKYIDITTNLKAKTRLYDSPTKSVLFTPIQQLDVQFSVPMTESDKNLEQFQTGCHAKVETGINEQLERVLCVRTIHKLESIPNDICSLVRNLYFIERTLGDHIADALEYFLVKQPKSKKSVRWKNKIEIIRDDLEIKKQRMGIYNEMLRKNVFPKYHEFVACNGNLKLLNVDRLLPRLARKH